MHVFFDFDSTVVTKETLDEAIAEALHTHENGVHLSAEVAEITTLGMEGKIPFLESLERRLAVIPLTKTLLEKVGTDMISCITPGMREVFEYLELGGHTVYIVTGGFVDCVLPTALSLNVPEERCIANQFRFEDGVAHLDLTRSPTIVGGKAGVLAALRPRFPTEKFVMVGDGMNDYKAYELKAANEFIGFGANVVRQSVKEKAKHFVMSSAELQRILASLI